MNLVSASLAAGSIIIVFRLFVDRPFIERDSLFVCGYNNSSKLCMHK